MATPVLWAPAIFWFFLLENPHAHKIPAGAGGEVVFWKGGVEVSILFLWAQGFFRNLVRPDRFDTKLLFASLLPLPPPMPAM